MQAAKKRANSGQQKEVKKKLELEQQNVDEKEAHLKRMDEVSVLARNYYSRFTNFYFNFHL